MEVYMQLQAFSTADIAEYVIVMGFRRLGPPCLLKSLRTQKDAKPVRPIV